MHCQQQTEASLLPLLLHLQHLHLLLLLLLHVLRRYHCCCLVGTRLLL
jgi:hypothetical protein